MEHTYYSVSKVAQMLGIHEKTVQRYIREGKLRATKVGKVWRISGHNLSVFMNGDDAPIKSKTANKPAKNKINVSSVIDIDVESMDEAMMLINMLTAALNSKPTHMGRSTMNAQFIEPESKVRVMLYGNVEFTENIMWVLNNYSNH